MISSVNKPIYVALDCYQQWSGDNDWAGIDIFRYILPRLHCLILSNKGRVQDGIATVSVSCSNPNIDTPNQLDDLYKREEITRAVLQSIDALPAEENPK